MNQEVIIVRGNHTLKGDVRVSGAKNSALKLMAASILGQGETILHNVPLISDIELMSEVLARLGATVVREGHTLRINTADVDSCETPYELVSKMRASISVLGPLIGRFGEARVAMPGGCQIGARKIDMHLVGLEALGVAFDVDHGVLAATTPNGLRGTHVYLEFPSVGATENMLMAAVTAEGHTAIENAACEPEIEDLANMLNAMGARVAGAGTSLIEIEGVPLSTRFFAHGHHEASGHGLRCGNRRRLDHRAPRGAPVLRGHPDAAAPRVPHRSPGSVHAAGGPGR